MKRIISLFLLSTLLSCTAEDSYDSPKERDDTMIRFAQWNIGHFNFGNMPNSSIGPESYLIELQQYKRIVKLINADVLAVCEYSEVFGENEKGKQYSREVLFNSFPYSFEGQQYSYACNALFSRIDIQNVQSTSYNNLKTHYYYLTANIPVGNIIIKIVCAHLAFNSSDDQFALIQINELISNFEDEEYVIMMGDWNIKDVDIFNLFADSGYQLANHGAFGDFKTFTDKKNARNRILDNIMAKGLNIIDVSTISKELSDHFPIVVTVQLPKDLVFNVSP